MAEADSYVTIEEVADYFRHTRHPLEWPHAKFRPAPPDEVPVELRNSAAEMAFGLIQEGSRE